MVKKRITNRPADRIIENSSAFKRNINKAFEKHLIRGGISANALIRKLQERAQLEEKKSDRSRLP
jgi:hypothetical protein